MPGSTLLPFTKITVTFSEPVGGVDAADLLVNGTPATQTTGAGAGPYTFTFTQPTNGPVQLSWAGNAAIHDFANAVNQFAGGSWSYTLNTGLVESDVVINEIMFHPPPNMPEDSRLEWVELFNRSANPINLTGW